MLRDGLTGVRDWEFEVKRDGPGTCERSRFRGRKV